MSTLSKVIAVFLLGLALALGVAAYRLANAPVPEPAPAPEPVAPVAAAPVAPVQDLHDVVVAGRDLKPGDILDADALTVKQWSHAPDSAFSTVQDLEGQVVRVSVAKGEPLIQAWLAQGLATYLDHDYRALSIPVDEVVAAGNTISPGDIVDVFFTLNRDRDQIEDTQARLLLSAVQVLAYGDQSLDGPIGTAGESSGRSGSNASRNARTAMLAIPLTDVNDMLLAVRSGSLQLVLRAPDDAGHPDRALFPERAPVLAGKAGLTTEQKSALEQAPNRAYAGASLPGLSGLNESKGNASPAAPSASRSTVSNGRRMQVIRGNQIQSVPY